MTTKPRVLCVMQMPPPVHGVTTINERVASSTVLASQFAIDVLPLRFADSLAQLRRISGLKLWRALRTGVELARRIGVDRPDLVYFTLAPEGIAFYRDCAYVALLKLFGVPRVYHLHATGVAQHLRSRWRAAAYRWVFDNAWVIQLSPALRGDTQELVPDARVLFVANGIPDEAELRERDHAGPPRVLFLSNMLIAKGPLVLLEALALLEQRGVPFQATFAGARFGDGCVEAFEASVSRLGLAHRVRYVGPAYGAAKTELLRSHDVFALPTLQDAFPVVVLEAMQAGLPVVSTAEGAISEMVEDGASGFVVPRGDAATLAARLEQLLQDRGLRRELGARGRVRFLEHYTLDRFEHALANALTRCLETRA